LGYGIAIQLSMPVHWVSIRRFAPTQPAFTTSPNPEKLMHLMTYLSKHKFFVPDEEEIMGTANERE